MSINFKNSSSSNKNNKTQVKNEYKTSKIEVHWTTTTKIQVKYEYKTYKLQKFKVVKQKQQNFNEI